MAVWNVYCVYTFFHPEKAEAASKQRASFLESAEPREAVRRETLVGGVGARMAFCPTPTIPPRRSENKTGKDNPILFNPIFRTP